eukprot:TRINITY_DN1198_c0_g1_i1.p1 TRINITY_DN1198_c0_g1~~TRINITY_DN1198_c0_g1_i1.p1  ORF type:complete len:143 (+),score=45.76 TRINITY_DN1198_c0_g1_i1:98-526(+)
MAPDEKKSEAVVIDSSKIVKQGYLEKLGGAAGGHKNWKKRWFIYHENTITYYESEAAYKEGKSPKGSVDLSVYYVCKTAKKGFGFSVHAYPRSLTCRADCGAEMEAWIEVLMKPIKQYISEGDVLVERDGGEGADETAEPAK